MTDTSPAVRSIRIREHDEDPFKKESADKYHEYVVSIHEDRVNVTHLESNRRRRWKEAPLRVLQDLFLPVGYPSSVNDGYLDYQIYDSVQGLSSYLRGVLCSAQVLHAAGVGRAEATALSAAMTWALKDGVSMLGGLVFSYTTSPLFDSFVKEFRLFADLINDVGLTLDMLAPYFQNLLLVASLAGLCKTLCGLSAWATKSSITAHFALEGNMADLNAKEATQETLVSLVGMLLGISLAHQLSKLQDSGSHALVIQMQWTIFISLTILHVWANAKGVCLLRLRTLNRERAEVVLASILDELESLIERSDRSSDSMSRLELAVMNLPVPTHVHESLWSSTSKLLWPGRLNLAANLTDILQCDSQVLPLFSKERYILTMNHRNEILVTLLTGAEVTDQLKAFIHGLLLARSTSRMSTELMTLSQRRELVQRTRDVANLLFADSLLQSSQWVPVVLLAKGWEIQERVYLGFPRRRSQWMDDDKKKE